MEHEPLAALVEANGGYIEHDHRNRHVMRAFIEAASVEERFRTILWNMRARHLRRFAKAMRRIHGVEQVDEAVAITSRVWHDANPAADGGSRTRSWRGPISKK